MSRRKRSRFTIDPILDELVDHLFNIRKNFRAVANGEFDYPDYGGLPKRIVNKLSSDVVDKIQCSIGTLSTLRSKKRFAEKLVPLVVEDFVVVK